MKIIIKQSLFYQFNHFITPVLALHLSLSKTRDSHIAPSTFIDIHEASSAMNTQISPSDGQVILTLQA
jgi:hypothetical protein